MIRAKYFIRDEFLVGLALVVVSTWRRVLHCDLWLRNEWESISCFNFSAYKHGLRRRQTLLLPTLYVCSRHRKHKACVQRLPWHHSTHASSPVRTVITAHIIFSRFRLQRFFTNNNHNQLCYYTYIS